MAAPTDSGPVAATAHGIVVVGGRAVLAPVAGRQPPPAAVEVDEDLLDRDARAGEGLGDRRARDDRNVMLCGRPAEEDDDRRSTRGGHDGAPQSPRKTISNSRAVAVRSRTSARTRSASARTSAAVPFWSLTMKLACFSDTTAPPIRRPLRPSVVDDLAGRRPVRRIPEHAAGRRQPQRLVGLAPAADVVEPALDHVGGLGSEAERRPEDEVGRGAFGDRHLEPAVAIAQIELRRLEAGLGPVGEQHVGRFEDRGDVVLVGAGVRPDGASDRARDRQPELQAGETGLLGLGRRPRHRHARLRGVAVAVDLRSLGPVLDDEAADPGVGDDDVAPPPEERVRQLAAAGEANERS